MDEYNNPQKVFAGAIQRWRIPLAPSKQSDLLSKKMMSEQLLWAERMNYLPLPSAGPSKSASSQFRTICEAQRVVYQVATQISYRNRSSLPSSLRHTSYNNQFLTTSHGSTKTKCFRSCRRNFYPTISIDRYSSNCPCRQGRRKQSVLLFSARSKDHPRRTPLSISEYDLDQARRICSDRYQGGGCEAEQAGRGDHKCRSR